MSELCVDTAASLLVTSVAIAALRVAVKASAEVSVIPCTPVVSDSWFPNCVAVTKTEVSAMP